MTGAQRDLGVRFLLAFVATILISPVAAILLPQFASHRVVSRTFMVCVVLAFVLRRGSRASWPDMFRSLGLNGPHRFARMLLGAGIAVAWLAALLWLSWAVGGREAAVPHKLSWQAHALRALITATAVGLLEEILFRGYLKNVLGGNVSALIYALVHFLSPPHGTQPADAYEPLLALSRLGDMLGGFANVRTVVMGTCGLFLFGSILNRMRERTGSIYLGIGLHGGLVFALQYYRRFLSVDSPSSPWVFGGSRFYDGIVGIGALALLYVTFARAPLPRFLKGPE